jgi:Spx/MgsR family transcriptional regulator
MITVNGLRNCDTCRKALGWLKTEGIAHGFVDVRADGVDEATVARWADAVGWETLLNRRGTTWRGLPLEEKEGIDGPRAVALMAAHPALIKRPVFEVDDEILVGFGDEVRARLAKGRAG